MKIQIFSHLKEVHNLGISVCRFAVGGIFPITFMGRTNLSANPKLFAEHKNRFIGCWQYCILLKIVVIYFTYRNTGLLDFHYYLDSGRVIANYEANISTLSIQCPCHRIMPWVKDVAEKWSYWMRRIESDVFLATYLPANAAAVFIFLVSQST